MVIPKIKKPIRARVDAKILVTCLYLEFDWFLYDEIWNIIDKMKTKGTKNSSAIKLNESKLIIYSKSVVIVKASRIILMKSVSLLNLLTLKNKIAPVVIIQNNNSL